MNFVQRAIARYIEKSAGGKFVPAAITAWQSGRNHLPRNNRTAQLAAYRSWVYVCASRNASTFASTPLRLYATKPSNKTRIIVPHREITKAQRKHLETHPGIQDLSCVRKAVDIVEITDHRWLNLMQSVNPFMNRFRLLEMTDLYQELTGDAFWYIVKNEGTGLPFEIWPLPVDRMRIVPSKDEFISHYEYRLGAQTIRFERDEIVHFVWPNPRDLFYGMSPLEGVAEMFNLNANMNLFENALFTNNARPEGFFSTKNSLSAANFTRLKEEILAVWTGIANAGKTGLLDSETTFTPINMSPRDLGFLKGREYTKSEIFEAYDTPTGLFSEKANRANAEAALYVYCRFGIEPRHIRFQEKLNEKLIPMFDENMFVAFDSCIPEDRTFELAKEESRINSGTWTRDEVRIEDGKEPMGNGADELLVQSTLVPIGTPSPLQVEGLVRRVVESVNGGGVS